MVVGVDMANWKALSEEEESDVLEAVGKSLPMRAAADYAGVEWERLERLMGKDKELRMRLAKAVAREHGRVMDLLKSKGGDVKALSFMLERVYGLSSEGGKVVKKEKGVSVGMTITPAVLKALSGGGEKAVKRN